MVQRTMIVREALLVAAAAAALAAQTDSGPTAVLSATPVAVATFAASNGAMTAFAGASLNSVAGQPFSAQEETESVQTLADGTRITNGGQRIMHYRDTLGRTRTERTPARVRFPGADSAPPPVFIDIFDPVAGYRYSFDSNSRTAQRSPVGPVRAQKLLPLQTTPSTLLAQRVAPNAAAVPSVSAQQQVQPEISREKLGTQTIEGLVAEGTRITTTYPVGFLGNDRPFTTVTETWTSREIGMTVLSRTSDPRHGETTTKLTNVSRAEPDPSLFQPPSGYEIVDPPTPSAAEVSPR
jgi:hypothetical protein